MFATPIDTQFSDAENNFIDITSKFYFFENCLSFDVFATASNIK